MWKYVAISSVWYNGLRKNGGLTGVLGFCKNIISPSYAYALPRVDNRHTVLVITFIISS